MADVREVLSTWLDLLNKRKTANGGYTVKTMRGNETVYTILATGKDLDDLAEILADLATERKHDGEGTETYAAEV